jgi:hypothetical protein
LTTKVKQTAMVIIKRLMISMKQESYNNLFFSSLLEIR